MVLGIFMCACLVGGLWYIAGIGSAIVYRERLQEAADATAFSGAVLHARGMNLIVLINLIMAMVLAIRVAMKVVQLALVIAGVLFFALSWFFPPFATAGGLCVKGATFMEDLIKATRPVINNALKALSKVEVGIAHVVPPASIAGSYQVADRYKPTVSLGFSGTSADRYAKGLPVEEGTTDRLCYEAGRAVGEILTWAIPFPMPGGDKVTNKFAGIMGNIVETAGAYFCEIGGKAGKVDLNSLVEGPANEACESRRKELESEFKDANTAWHHECDRLQVTCIDEDPNDPFNPRPNSEMTGGDKLSATDKASLQQLKSTRDAKSDAVKSFEEDKCRADKKKEMKQGLQSQQQQQQTSGEGMTPKKVEAKWSNGRKDTQMIAWINGDDRLLRRAPGGVKIGAWKKTRPGDIDKPIGADFAFAQAEFFYDCSGKWEDKDGDCNGPHGDQEEAMWHFRWRARLRRYNTPYNDLPQILEAVYLLPAEGSLVARAAEAGAQLNSYNEGNIALKKELAQSIGTSAKTYAIH